MWLIVVATINSLSSLSLLFSPCVYFSPRRTQLRVLNFGQSRVLALLYRPKKMKHAKKIRGPPPQKKIYLLTNSTLFSSTLHIFFIWLKLDLEDDCKIIIINLLACLILKIAMKKTLRLAFERRPHSISSF